MSLYLHKKVIMQLTLPIFPDDIKMINFRVGLKKENDFVYYMLNGQSIYCHSEQDRNSYRYIMSNLVSNGLCTISELSTALGVNRKNIERYVKSFKEHGADYFFNREDNRGQCYRFTEDVKNEAQRLLDMEVTPYTVAKKTGLSESAIRYHLQNGDLKKK